MRVMRDAVIVTSAATALHVAALEHTQLARDAYGPEVRSASIFMASIVSIVSILLWLVLMLYCSHLQHS